jgi:hypothetical protein
LEAEAGAERGEFSTQRAPASLKGKNKIVNPALEDVPFHPVPITPLSRGPRFSQVVGSSSKIPVVSPNPVAVAASSLAGRFVIGAAAAVAMATVNPGAGRDGAGRGRGDGRGDGGQGRGDGGRGRGCGPVTETAVAMALVETETGLPLPWRTKPPNSSTTCGTIPPQMVDAES